MACKKQAELIRSLKYIRDLLYTLCVACMRYYYSLSLLWQLMMILPFLTFFIVSMLSLLTVFSMNDFKDSVLSSYKSLLLSSLAKSLSQIGLEKSQFFVNQFTFIADLGRTVNDIQNSVLLHKLNMVSNPPINCAEIASNASNYTTGCYITPSLQLTNEGMALLRAQASMDVLFHSLSRPSIAKFYAGFYADSIFYFYPSHFSANVSYIPEVNHWFYQAIKHPSTVMITEPYIDLDSEKWVAEVTKPLTDADGKFLGVGGFSLDLQWLVDAADVQFLNTGFISFLTTGGVLVNIPVIWRDGNATVLKIFDVNITGISELQWLGYLEVGSEALQNFTTADNKSYYFTLQPVFVDTDGYDVTFYVMVCIAAAEALENYYGIEQEFAEIQENVLAVVEIVNSAVLGLVILVVIGFGIWHYITFRRYRIEIVEFVKHSLAITVERGNEFHSRLPEDSGVLKNVQARYEEVIALRNSSNYWEFDTKRPRDTLIYNTWMAAIPPSKYQNIEETSTLHSKLQYLFKTPAFITGKRRTSLE